MSHVLKLKRKMEIFDNDADMTVWLVGGSKELKIFFEYSNIIVGKCNPLRRILTGKSTAPLKF